MLKINQSKATVIAKDKLRISREKAFKDNDLRIQNAMIDCDDVAKNKAITYRNYLRDIPTLCDGKTVEELKAMVGIGLPDYASFTKRSKSPNTPLKSLTPSILHPPSAH